MILVDNDIIFVILFGKLVPEKERKKMIELGIQRSIQKLRIIGERGKELTRWNRSSGSRRRRTKNSTVPSIQVHVQVQVTSTKNSTVPSLQVHVQVQVTSTKNSTLPSIRYMYKYLQVTSTKYNAVPSIQVHVQVTSTKYSTGQEKVGEGAPSLKNPEFS